MLPDLTQYIWILWISLVLVAVVLELLTLQLVFLMVAAGCLVGGLGGWLLHLPWWAQIGGAAVLTGLLVFLIRPLLWRLLVAGRPVHRTNVDALAGMTARATAAFTDGGGLARLANGETWTARLDDAHEDDAIVVGARLVVTAIDGATAVVTPAPIPDRGADAARPAVDDGRTTP